MFMALVTRCAALALLAFSATPALAAGPTTNLTFCNKNGAKLDLAVAYQDTQTGHWMMSAWHGVGAGECKPFGAVKTGLFYYYAENSATKGFYPATQYIEKRYCLPRSAIKRQMLNVPCAVGEKQYGFRGRTPNPGNYTFTFN